MSGPFEPPAFEPDAPFAPPPAIDPAPATDPDPRSFAERYRGTAWSGEVVQAGDVGHARQARAVDHAGGADGAGEGPVPVEPAVAAGRDASATTRRGPGGLIWIGALLLGGSVATGALLVLSGFDGTIGGPAPTDTLPRIPDATSDPTVTAAAIDGFLGLVGDPKLTYEVRMRGSLEVGGGTVTTRLSAKVAGANVDVRYVLEGSTAPKQETRVIAVGSRTWVQAAGSKAWKKVRTRPSDLPDLHLLEALTGADQLRHVGAERRRGYRTEHLRTAPWWVSPMATRTISSNAGATVDLSRLDVWVLPDGRPIEVIHTFSASVPTMFGRVVVAGTATYVLARVGEKVTVKAPK